MPLRTYLSYPNEEYFLGDIMEGLAAAGFAFSMLGLVAFVRLEKLTKTLKEKGILEEDYKDE